MKRMIAFIFAVLSLLCINFTQKQQIDFSCAQRAVLITSNPFENKDFLCSGSDYYTHFEGDEVGEVLTSLHEVQGLKGLNLYFSNALDLSYFRSKIDYLSDKTIVGDYDIYYGYCNQFEDFKWVDGKKVNVQLAKTADGWIMGIPIILTGF
ncbi:MAG: hypothetical protein IJY90_01955 [Clostridia bacterium]|nr:hypothetical protein [Clostridia bacterium]